METEKRAVEIDNSYTDKSLRWSQEIQISALRRWKEFAGRQ